MASLVGVFAASHGPMIAREWDSLTPPTRAAVEQGFDSVGQRLIAIIVRMQMVLISEPRQQPGGMARIAQALEKHGNNRLRTASELGISRMTLYKKLYKYGLMNHDDVSRGGVA